MAQVSMQPDQVLPGTTIPGHKTNGASHALLLINEPSTTPGPSVHDRATVLTLYSPDQLPHSPVLPSLQTVINQAFQETGLRHKIFGKVLRLRTLDQFLQELGREPGTFTYILTYAGTREVVGTVSLRRFVRPVAMAVEAMDEDSRQRYQTFTRFELPACAVGDDGLEVEAWELKLMAVDPGVQRQGVAGGLIKMVEAEARRRFRARGVSQNRRRRLVLLLTCIMEINGGFYKGKGYVLGSEQYYHAGHLDSEKGLTIGHMSKVLDEV